MTIEEMYAEICELEDGLTEWELEFIESVGDRVDKDRLSELQRAVIERLFYKLCSGGTYYA